MRGSVCFRVAVTVLLGLLCAMSQAQQLPEEISGQRFQFRYEVGRPFRYAIGMRVRLDMHTKAGAEDQNMKMLLDTRYTVSLTPRSEPKQGITPVRIEPSGIEGDWDVHSPGGHLVVTLRGGEIRGTHNGLIVMDTAKGVGREQAQELKKELLLLTKSGMADLDTRGNVKQFRGDPDFVRFWNEMLENQTGLFGVIFPVKAVAVGDSWMEAVTVRKMGEMRLEGEGIRVDAVFTRQPDETVQDRRLAVFRCSAPLKHREIAGSMAWAGRKISVKLLELDQQATGVMKYDFARGLISEASVQSDRAATVELSVPGQSLAVEMKVRMEIRWRLIPDGPEAPPLSSKAQESRLQSRLSGAFMRAARNRAERCSSSIPFTPSSMETQPSKPTPRRMRKIASKSFMPVPISP